LFGSMFFSSWPGEIDGNYNSDLTIKTSESETVSIPIWYHQRTAYISSSALAKTLQYQTYFNDKKKKIVLYLPENQVVLTANNAYVIIDNQVYQMPATTLWYKNEVYVPIKYLIPLLNRRTTLELQLGDSEKELLLSSSKFNINNVIIDERQNGTVIRILTNRRFGQQEITADMRYGWLHVDFYGGKVDTKKVKSSPTTGLVRSVNTFQFDELASLAFRLRNDPVSREVINNSAENEVLVVLRTKEEVSQKELSELPESLQEEKTNDLMKQLEEERNKWLIDVVVIDPGHGGRDPGCVSAGKIYEKDIVLSIASKLGEILEKEMPEVKVVYTRKSDKYVELNRRTEIANRNKGKVFVSIHINASPKKNVRGFETYFLGPEKGERAKEVVLLENSVIKFEDSSTRTAYEGINSILASMYQEGNMRYSEHLASLVQKGMNNELKSINMSDRGVKQGPFWVMVGATMPNILVEAGYITNSYDLKILKTAKYQRKIAMGIFLGLKQYKSDYEKTI
jgi:N-acetylmuramoyl-L-alanine amidase